MIRKRPETILLFGVRLSMRVLWEKVSNSWRKPTSMLGLWGCRPQLEEASVRGVRLARDFLCDFQFSHLILSL